MPAIDRIVDLGLVDFKQALELQKKLFEQIKTGSLGSALVFCRHLPVITLGRRSSASNILAGSETLERSGIPVYPVDRGGDVTYHGPGQLVVYPVLHLSVFKKDIHFYLRKLEETVIGLLRELGVNAGAREGFTGVWVGGAKIASIGICVRNWISYHGLALNVERGDLDNFSLIRPCGMDIEMTSLETLLGQKIDFGEIQRKFTRRFEYA